MKNYILRTWFCDQDGCCEHVWLHSTMKIAIYFMISASNPATEAIFVIFRKTWQNTLPTLTRINKTALFKMLQQACIFTLDSLCVDILRYVMNTLLWTFSCRVADVGGRTDDASKFLIAGRKKSKRAWKLIPRVNPFKLFLNTTHSSSADNAATRNAWVLSWRIKNMRKATRVLGHPHEQNLCHKIDCFSNLLGFVKLQVI